MSAFIDVCNQINDFIQSDAVKAALDEVYPHPWKSAVAYELNEGIANTPKNLKVSIMPGAMQRTENVRITMANEYRVGVHLRKLVSLDEIPELSDFTQELILRLNSFNDVVRSLNSGRYAKPILQKIEMTGIYADTAMDAFRAFDCLILMTFQIDLIKERYRKNVQ